MDQRADTADVSIDDLDFRAPPGWYFVALTPRAEARLSLFGEPWALRRRGAAWQLQRAADARVAPVVRDGHGHIWAFWDGATFADGGAPPAHVTTFLTPPEHKHHSATPWRCIRYETDSPVVQWTSDAYDLAHLIGAHGFVKTTNERVERDAAGHLRSTTDIALEWFKLIAPFDVRAKVPVITFDYDATLREPSLIEVNLHGRPFSYHVRVAHTPTRDAATLSHLFLSISGPRLLKHLGLASYWVTMRRAVLHEDPGHQDEVAHGGASLLRPRVPEGAPWRDVVHGWYRDHGWTVPPPAATSGHSHVMR